MSEKLSVQEVKRLGLYVGLDFTDFESADVCSRLDKQICGIFVAFKHIDTTGVQPTFDICGGERFKLERRGNED